MNNIGFIGLGNMGRPMASNLCRKGHKLLAFDIEHERIRAVEAAGGTAARDIAAVAGDTDIIFTMLPTTAAVEDVVGQQLIPSGRSGQVIVDMSTISPVVSRDTVEKGLVDAEAVSVSDRPPHHAPQHVLAEALGAGLRGEHEPELVATEESLGRGIPHLAACHYQEELVDATPADIFPPVAEDLDIFEDDGANP